MEKKKLRIQIRVPDFGGRPDMGLVRAYTAALLKELSAAKDELKEYVVTTFHIENASGLGQEGVSQLLLLLRKIGLDAPEIAKTVSLAPDRTNAAILTPLRNFGIGSYQFLLGSLNVNDFKALNRPYALKTYDLLFCLLEACQLTQYEVGLSIGLPGQNQASLTDSLKRVFERNPDAVALKPVPKSSNPLTVELFALADRLLLENGYERSDISVYRKPGSFCAPLSGGKEEVWGFGLGATSFLEGCLLRNTTDWLCYLEHAEEPEQLITQCVRMDERSLAKQELLFGLQRAEGVELSGLDAYFTPFVEELLKKEEAKLSENKLRLTHPGIVNAQELWERLDMI